MPRAPHSSALLAGSPLAKRSVFSIRMSRIRSIPFRRPMSTRLTRGTAASRPSGCQMKASAWASESAAEAAGDAAERWVTIASNAHAIRSGASPPEACTAICSDVDGVFRKAALGAERGASLRGFFDILGLPDHAPLTGLTGGRKRRKSGVGRRCNWDRGRYSPREFARIGSALGRPAVHSRSTRIARMLITPAFAQAAGGGDTNSMLMSLLPFALIFVIMYFLILRPQQKKVKDHAELVKNIRRGDTVVTSGGLVGKVTKVVDDDQIEFEISDGVRVRQMRQMISGVRAKGEPAKEKSELRSEERSAG